MLQWIPGSDRQVLWNERQGDRFVSRVFDVTTGESHILPAPVYTIAPDGKTAIGADFRRINHMRPGYGFAGIRDPNHDILAPEDEGIYRLDLSGDGETVGGDSGKKLLISIAEVAALPYRHAI